MSEVIGHTDLTTLTYFNLIPLKKAPYGQVSRCRCLLHCHSGGYSLKKTDMREREVGALFHIYEQSRVQKYFSSEKFLSLAYLQLRFFTD